MKDSTSAPIEKNEMKRRLIVAILVAIVAIAFEPSLARAQLLPEDQGSVSSSSAESQAQSQVQSDQQTESLYQQYEQQQNALQKRKEEERQAAREREQNAKYLNYQPKNISGLVRLAPFTDIAVIQRRYLPKTGRFEFSASGVISTNNAFFNNIGLNARLAYYFNDKYGVEGIYQLMTSSNRPITQGLISNQKIETQSLVEPKGFYGLTFNWSPIYGKMAWFQQKIIPFDIYFSPGLGVTQTSNDSGDTTVMLGVGQLFALSKSYGIRWDFNWNYYNATTSSTDTTGTVTSSTSSHSDLFLGVGFSYFFPEATYR